MLEVNVSEGKAPQRPSSIGSAGSGPTEEKEEEPRSPSPTKEGQEEEKSTEGDNTPLSASQGKCIGVKFIP